MWVSGRAYRLALEHLEQLRADLSSLALDIARERARRETLEHQAIRDRALIEFLCTRVNQSETERAVLLKTLTKADIPIATLSTPAPFNLPTDPSAAVLGVDMFTDMGDDEAKRRGVRWAGDGSVVYGTPEAP
jgi:hypothetical protein